MPIFLGQFPLSMLDPLDWKIINHGLEHGQFTETNLRSHGFNYTTTKPRLDKLVERKFLQKTKAGRQKYVYDIGEPQWKRIVEEEAKSSGKLVPTLPLEQVKALISSKYWSKIKLESVEFDLVGYRKRKSGSFGIIREKMFFKPGPGKEADRAPLRDMWHGLQKQAKELKVEDQQGETIARVSIPMPLPTDPPLVDLSTTKHSWSLKEKRGRSKRAERMVRQNELLEPWSSRDSFETVRDEVIKNTTTNVIATPPESQKSKPTFTTLTKVKLERRDGRLYAPEYHCFVAEVEPETLRKMLGEADPSADN